METLGNRIEKLRKKLGYTQNELAEKLIISNKAVYKWEKDLCNPSIDLLPQLANVFDCSIDYLITGEDYCDSNSIDIDLIKERFLDKIQPLVSNVTYDVWISTLEFISLKNNILYLTTPSFSSKEIIEKKYFNVIINVLNQILPEIKNVIIDIEK